MQVYIIPYNRASNNFLNLVTAIELFEVYYKTDSGPLGFNQDDKGKILFRLIVEGTIWYSAYNGNVKYIDKSYLDNNKMIGFNGVFMASTEFVTREVEKERELQLTIIKNRPLKKYNKPIKQEIPSFFTSMYDTTNRKYSEHKIETLVKLGVDIAVGDSDSLGTHFIIKRDSLFMRRLISGCEQLNIITKEVMSYKEISAW